MKRLALQILAVLLISAALAVASNTLRTGGLPWSGSQPEALVYRNIDWISVEDAAPLQDDVMTLFLDARPQAQFAQRRVFGSVSLPADDLQANWVEIRDFLDTRMTLIVYADDPNLTVRVVEFLAARSFQVEGLGGGWEAWQDAHLPEERGNP